VKKPVKPVEEAPVEEEKPKSSTEEAKHGDDEDWEAIDEINEENNDSMEIDDTQSTQQEDESQKTVVVSFNKDEIDAGVEKEEEPKKKKRTTTVKRKTKEDRSIEMYIHETLLVTFLAYHLKRCELSDNELVQATLYSLIPKKFHFNEVIEIDDDDEEEKPKSKKLESLNIKHILKWFEEMFHSEGAPSDDEVTPRKRLSKKKTTKKKEEKPQMRTDAPYTITVESLLTSIQKGQLTELETIISCTALLKSLGYLCRLVTVIDPEQFLQQTTKEKKKISPLKKASASTENLTNSFQHNDLWVEVYAVNDRKWLKLTYKNGSMSSGIASATTNFFEGFMFKKEEPKKKEKEVELTADSILRRLCTLPAYVIGVTSHRHQCVIQDVTELHFVNKQNQKTLIATQQYEEIDQWFHNDAIAPINATIRRRTKDLRSKDLPLLARIIESENDRILHTQLLMGRELPTTQEAYKNHPIYCIKKYINKYEAFYPEDPPSIGKVGDFEVYDRKYLHELHAKDRWIKEGRQVVTGEVPYKIVKASHMSSKENTELFGKWQTIEYIAPVASNGVVPKNERGQVDLWHERMLPKGTVHLNITGIGRVAKKLKIDYAPAMTGFEIHGKRSVPKIEGVVVCEEFEDVLRDACVESERLRLAKVQARVDARVYKHWRRLILRLLAREEVNTTYKDILEKEEREEQLKKEKALKKKKTKQEDEEEEYKFEESENPTNEEAMESEQSNNEDDTPLTKGKEKMVEYDEESEEEIETRMIKRDFNGRTRQVEEL
jgi:hypothetical protein